GWAEAAASNGLVGVYPDLRPGGERAQLAALLEHLRENAGRYGIDPERVVIYAASANVSRALPLVQAPAMTDVAAAVMYYGSADLQAFRPDLPVLFVRAGLDRPGVNENVDRLVARASSQNAPVWLLNHPAGYHGFEVRNDDAATRTVIDQTLDFARRVTEPGFRAALRAGIMEAMAAGHMARGSYAEAARLYGELVRARPGEPTLGLAYGEALLADGRFADACAWFDRLREAPLGFRDRGMPAARACLRAGDEDAAVAWLASIPPRHRPSSLATDPDFEALRDRADFRALFEPR
ncbi:MAG TPA: tetratricopeptide repeat protein, partial [Longimicrobiales bacterium]|nr:tetratricopeptide repeat protein [Longimicrobiales bacterium]